MLWTSFIWTSLWLLSDNHSNGNFNWMFCILQKKVTCFNMTKTKTTATTTSLYYKFNENDLKEEYILAIVKMNTTTSFDVLLCTKLAFVQSWAAETERQGKRAHWNIHKAEGKTIWRFHYHVNISSLWLFHYAHFTSNITDDRCSVFFQYPM